MEKSLYGSTLEDMEDMEKSLYCSTLEDMEDMEKSLYCSTLEDMEDMEKNDRCTLAGVEDKRGPLQKLQRLTKRSSEQIAPGRERHAKTHRARGGICRGFLQTAVVVDHCCSLAGRLLGDGACPI